jgi:hypothetical protein
MMTIAMMTITLITLRRKSLLVIKFVLTMR